MRGKICSPVGCNGDYQSAFRKRGCCTITADPRQKSCSQPQAHPLRPCSYPETLCMKWQDYYVDGFVDPLYAQYIRNPCENVQPKCSFDSNNDCSKIIEPTPLIKPELVRRNKGWTFQKMFPSDPCPQGWVSFESLPPDKQSQVLQSCESDPRGFCFLAEVEFEPVMYTDKFSWYNNSQIMPSFNDSRPTCPPSEYKDFGYKTTRSPGMYKRTDSKWSLLY